MGKELLHSDLLVSQSNPRADRLMARKPIMFDLGCGLGGASAAMRDRGWIVYRIDREHDVKAERHCDLRNLISLPGGIDLLWASTSCAQFTVTALPFASAVNARRPIDLSVELAVRRLIDQSKPHYWLVENVPSSRRWLTPIFGPVRCRTGGHVLWGNLPLMVSPVAFHKRKLDYVMWHSRRRHLLKSKIPYELSEAIAKTVESLV